jgi:two-component system response regulator GlrR
VIGKSKAFAKTLTLIKKIGACDVPVLIEGETGTGKELAAREIHYTSTRRDGPFVPVNCGAIPDALVENELFGHKQGAYTDARHDYKGLIGFAQGGTLFLDEVDALTPKAQVTLLRFLQDQQYRPVGGHEARSANVRIIAASNADLAELAQSNAFRLDLLFRLKLLYLKLPAVREREEDVLLLADHFLRACAVRFGIEKQLHAETAAWFPLYRWPGNVRELENLICREYLLADDSVIRITAPVSLGPDRRVLPDRRRPDFTSLNFNEAKNRVIGEFERRYLVSVLSASGGNVTRAAKLVGKERRAFGKLLKKHRLDKRQYSN